MVGTILFKLSETPEGEGETVILAQVATEDTRELEEYANKIAKYADSLATE